MESRVILSDKQLSITLHRLCHQLIENHGDFSQTVFLGLQPRGIYLARRIVHMLKDLCGCSVTYGELDITFYRDDVRRHESPLIPSSTKVDFLIENKKVVLIDDVLFTGRTIRAGLDAMLAFGRPTFVELLVLVDRRFSRELPIQPDYIGKVIDAIDSERVKVFWNENDGLDQVTLFNVQQKNE